MNDRATKILLALIALGLWANVLGPVLKPLPAYASDTDRLLSRIDDSLNDIARGYCSNKKLC
jgi:hypothetical protein